MRHCLWLWWPHLPENKQSFSSFPIAIHQIRFVVTQALEYICFVWTLLLPLYARKMVSIYSQGLGHLVGRPALPGLSEKNNFVNKYNLHMCTSVLNNTQVWNATLEVIVVIGTQRFVRHGHRSLLYFCFFFLLFCLISWRCIASLLPRLQIKVETNCYCNYNTISLFSIYLFIYLPQIPMDPNESGRMSVGTRINLNTTKYKCDGEENIICKHKQKSK